jgi:hypothetical protein
VFTRFSFHHFSDPLTVLKEMVRVCAEGGRVVVCAMYGLGLGSRGGEGFDRNLAVSPPR